MRIIYYSVICFLVGIGQSSTAQLPNPSFEEWVQYDSIENPLHWKTNNVDSYFNPVTKTAGLVAGDYAMKVESRGPSFEGFTPGWAKSAFLPLNSLESIELTYRIDSIEDGLVTVRLTQKPDSVEYEIGLWTGDQLTNGIQELTIPVSPLSQDSVTLTIKAANSQGPTQSFGHAEVVVDHIKINEVSATKELSHPQITLHPNPVVDLLHFEFNGGSMKDGELVIYNGTGQLIERIKIHAVSETMTWDASNRSQGVYFYQLTSDNTMLDSGKFILMD